MSIVSENPVRLDAVDATGFLEQTGRLPTIGDDIRIIVNQPIEITIQDFRGAIEAAYFFKAKLLLA